MFIINRNIFEAIMIGDDICVTVLELDGNRVRLGIDAPEHVIVHRKEVSNRIQREKKDEALID